MERKRQSEIEDETGAKLGLFHQKASLSGASSAVVAHYFLLLVGSARSSVQMDEASVQDEVVLL